MPLAEAVGLGAERALLQPAALLSGLATYTSVHYGKQAACDFCMFSSVCPPLTLFHSRAANVLWQRLTFSVCSVLYAVNTQRLGIGRKYTCTMPLCDKDMLMCSKTHIYPCLCAKHTCIFMLNKQKPMPMCETYIYLGLCSKIYRLLDVCGSKSDCRRCP